MSNKTTVLLVLCLIPTFFIFYPTNTSEATYRIPQFFARKNLPVNMLFVGDVMLDRNVAVRAKQFGDDILFSGVTEFFKNHDAIVGNLEGTITSFDPVAKSTSEILRFTFDPHYAPFLKSVGFSALSSANNHSYDFGKSGYDQTIQNLLTAGIASFGSPYNTVNLSTQLPLENKQVCLVGYHQLFNPSATSTLAEIASIRPHCTYVILMAHWGEEYSSIPTQAERNLAHEFIDGGADLIIGAHPHVVQPMEVYKNKAIFYSLGNFMFDQDFSAKTQRGLVVDVTFHASSTNFYLVPVSIVKEQVTIAGATTTKEVLNEVGVATSTFDLFK